MPTAARSRVPSARVFGASQLVLLSRQRSYDDEEQQRSAKIARVPAPQRAIKLSPQMYSARVGVPLASCA
jgi:hypothetical protein